MVDDGVEETVGTTRDVCVGGRKVPLAKSAAVIPITSNPIATIRRTRWREVILCMYHKPRDLAPYELLQ